MTELGESERAAMTLSPTWEQILDKTVALLSLRGAPETRDAAMNALKDMARTADKYVALIRTEPKTLDDVLFRATAVFPAAVLGEDNERQMIIYTGLYQRQNGIGSEPEINLHVAFSVNGIEEEEIKRFADLDEASTWLDWLGTQSEDISLLDVTGAEPTDLGFVIEKTDDDL